MPMNQRLQDRLDSINGSRVPERTPALMPDLNIPDVPAFHVTSPVMTDVLDKLMAQGWKAGDLAIVHVQRPSEGKSRLTEDLAMKFARENNIPLVFTDLELPVDFEEQMRLAAIRMNHGLVSNEMPEHIREIPTLTEIHPDFVDTVPSAAL